MAQDKQQKAEQGIFLQACIARGVQLRKEKETQIETLRVQHEELSSTLRHEASGGCEADQAARRLQEAVAELNQLRAIHDLEPDSDLTTLPRATLCTLVLICTRIDITYDPALKPHEFFKIWMHSFVSSTTKPDGKPPLEQRSQKELLELLAGHLKRLRDAELIKVPPVCWVRCSSVLSVQLDC